MRAVQVQHYIRRAMDFFEGMQLTRGDENYWNSSALLAIHSAVSFTDALRIGLGDLELSADDHKKAIASLQKLLSTRHLEDQTGFQHLQDLISKKNLIAYRSHRLERTDYEKLFTKAERFAKWANNVGSQLKVEGWQHGDQ